MALLVTPLTSSAQIAYHYGVDETGKEKKVTRSFTGFKTDMEDQDIYDVANIVIDLQEPTVTGIFRIDKKGFGED